MSCDENADAISWDVFTFDADSSDVAVGLPAAPMSRPLYRPPPVRLSHNGDVPARCADTRTATVAPTPTLAGRS